MVAFLAGGDGVLAGVLFMLRRVELIHHISKSEEVIFCPARREASLQCPQICSVQSAEYLLWCASQFVVERDGLNRHPGAGTVYTEPLLFSFI